MAVEVAKRGPGRPKGSTNKPKPAAKPPVIDDGMDDDDEGGDGQEEFEGLDEVAGIDDIDVDEEVEEPDDEDMNLPSEYVEDALRSAPKKAPLKPEPLPERKAAKAEEEKPKAGDGTAKELKTLAGQIAALTTVVGALEKKVTEGLKDTTLEARTAATGVRALAETVDDMGKKVDTLVGNLSALEAYLADALGDANAKARSEPAAKKKAEPAEEVPRKAGLSPEDKARLTRYVGIVHGKLQAGKRYAIRSVVSNAQEKFGPEIATPSRIQGLLEELGIKIVDAREGFFSVIASEE